MKNIYEIAKKAGIAEKYVIPYGSDKAKIDLAINETLKNKENGKLVLVTAITPTKAGEGKTTSSIALTDGLNYIGVPSLACLREPSLGPVFGLKGGATGGGKVSLYPAEDINLHFTGDLHALTSSINLIAAVIDNHIFQGNELRIDPDRILWKRALDMNDRALRSVTIMQDEKKGTPRHDEFVITVASELMAIFCLAKDAEDFQHRVNEIIVALDVNGDPVRLKDLRISNAVMKLMRQAINPNLVQTLEGNPVIIHGGPFANIAHGCNSIIATKLALKLAPIVVTEAGFGADLGAEKFLDIKCRVGGLKPDAVVMVATIRALKLHGGQTYEELDQENIEALLAGTANLKHHMDTIAKYGVPAVICINHFASDTERETEALKAWCKQEGFEYAFCTGFADGAKGCQELAKLVKKTLEEKESHYHPLYDENLPIKDKIDIICKEVYGAKQVIYKEDAEEQIRRFEALGFAKTPVCIAKTPLSITANPKIQGAPTDFDITVKEVRLSAGAGFIVALTGSIMTMPGLPKVPAAVKMEDE